MRTPVRPRQRLGFPRFLFYITRVYITRDGETGAPPVAHVVALTNEYCTARIRSA